MEKVSETGVEKFTQRIGSDGAVMNIRKETTPDGVFINAPVGRDGKNLALLARQQDGKIVLCVYNDSMLTVDEFYDVFEKSAEVVGEIMGIKKPE